MTLGEKQRLFTHLIGKLILWAYENGYELSFGEAKRTQAQADLNAAAGTGISNSLHLVSLAVDFNLFKDGLYLSTSEAHRRMGTYWKSLHPDCRWGGDFMGYDKDGMLVPKPDGNHYSLTFEGRK